MTPQRLKSWARRIAVGAVVAALGTSTTWAHPHTWVLAMAQLGFDAEHQVEGVSVAFALDEMTTAILLEGLDANGNGVYDAEELHALAEENAISLAEFDYFTELRAADKLVKISGLTGYDYVFENGQLILRLDIALERRVDPIMEAVTLRLYDPTFYVMVELVEEPVAFVGSVPSACGTSVTAPEAPDIMSLSESMFDTESPDLLSIGRDFADVITIACPPQS